MSNRKLGMGVLSLAAAGLLVWSMTSLTASAEYAQIRKQARDVAGAGGAGRSETTDQPAKRGAMGTAEKPKPGQSRLPAAKEVTHLGRIGDLHSVMTQTYASDDKAQATADALKLGVPPVLESTQGVFLLGMEGKNPAEKLIPLAYQEVLLKGKLYTRGMVRYLDIISVEKAPAPATPAGAVKAGTKASARTQPAGADAAAKRP